jgi:nitrogen fixation protein FixH
MIARAPAAHGYRWIPWAIVAIFAGVAAVNGALAYFALHSDPGLVAKHPFELGNGYNEILAEGEAEAALGWKGTVRFVAGAQHAGTIVAELRDASGAALEGLSVSVAVVRPVEPLPPQIVTLDPAGGAGYSAPVTLPRPGLWELRVTASRGADTYHYLQRIVAP